MSGTAVHGGFPGRAGLGWARGTDDYSTYSTGLRRREGAYSLPAGVDLDSGDGTLCITTCRTHSLARGCPLLAFVESRCCQAAGTALGVVPMMLWRKVLAAGDKIGQIRLAVTIVVLTEGAWGLISRPIGAAHDPGMLYSTLLDQWSRCGTSCDLLYVLALLPPSSAVNSLTGFAVPVGVDAPVRAHYLGELHKSKLHLQELFSSPSLRLVLGLQGAARSRQRSGYIRG